MKQKIILLFLFSSIFTNAFAINSFVTPALGISALIFFIFLSAGTRNIAKTRSDSIVIAFWLLFSFSLVLMASGEKRYNSYVMWSYPIFIYYFVFKNVLYRFFDYEKFSKKVLGVVTFSVFCTSSFAIFEYLSVNFLGIDFSFIPRGALTEYTPLSIGGIRARSFMEESGQFAFFLEIFAPLAIYWIINNVQYKLLRYLFYFILLTSVVVSFSAVGFVCLAISFVLLSYYYVIIKPKTSFRLIFLCLILFLTYLYFSVPEIGEFIGSVVGGKLDPDNTSNAQRSSRFSVLELYNGIELLIGYGPAAYSTLKVESAISFYLGVFMNTGIIGLILMFSFLFSKWNIVKSIRNFHLHVAFMISLVLSCAHLCFIDLVYVPWFWVLLSFIDFVYLNERKGTKLNCQNRLIT